MPHQVISSIETLLQKFSEFVEGELNHAQVNRLTSQVRKEIKVLSSDRLTQAYYQMQLHEHKRALFELRGEKELAEDEESDLNNWKDTYQDLLAKELESEEKTHQSLHHHNQDEPDLLPNFSNDNSNDNSNHSAEDLLLGHLKQLDQLLELDKKVYDEMDRLVRSAIRPVESFASYLSSKQEVDKIDMMIREAKTKLISSNFEGEPLQERQICLDDFNVSLTIAVETNLAEFIEPLLSDKAMLRKSFFADIELTEQEVNRVYRRLSIILHPDKRKGHPKEFIFTEVFTQLALEKEAILKKLQQAKGSQQDVQYHIERASQYWQVVLDWQDAEKSQYDNLRVLSRSEVQNKTSNEKKYNKQELARRCSQQYRAACKAADRIMLSENNNGDSSISEVGELENQRVDLRKKIALCLYVAGFHFDAQLYAIGAMQLLLASPTCTEEGLQGIRAILDKINKNSQVDSAPASETANMSSTSQTQLEGQNAVIVSKSRELQSMRGRYVLPPLSSPKGRVERSKLLQQELSKDLIQYLAKPESRLANYTTSPDIIVHTENRALSYKVSGAARVAGGLVVSGFAVGTLISEIAAATATSAATGAALGSIGGPIGIGVGISFGLMQGIAAGASIYFGYKMFKEGSELAKEPKIRKRLNENVTEGINCYQLDDYQGCLRAFAKFYDDDNSLSLIKFSDDARQGYLEVDAKQLRDTLLHHEFHPDGVAYLLILLGEILTKGCIKLPRTPASTQREQAAALFLVAADKAPGDEDKRVLIGAAEQLDQLIESVWVTKEGGSWHYKFRQFLGQRVFNLFHDVPQSYIERCKKESNSAPYVGRLREVQLTANLNFALLQLIIGNPDSFEVASQTVCDMYDFVHHSFQYFSITETRLLAIEDFLAALGYDPELLELSKRAPQESSTESMRFALEYMPTNLTNESGRAIQVRSFITGLNQPIDVLNLLCSLTYGLVNLSYAEFREKLVADLPDENDNNNPDGNGASAVIPIMKERLDKEGTLDSKILAQDYLPILSQILRVNFKLYEFVNSEDDRSLTPVSSPSYYVADSLATICLVVDIHFFQNAAPPQLVFIEDNTPELQLIAMRIDLASKQQGAEQLLKEAYLDKANYYFQLASQVDTRTHARSLIIYEEALTAYEQSLSLVPSHKACWGIARCYLALGQVKALLDFLEIRGTDSTLNLTSTAQYWYFKAKAFRKLQDYLKAMMALQKATEIGAAKGSDEELSSEFDRERRSIEVLSNINRRQKQEAYKITHFNLDSIEGYQTRQNMHLAELPSYDILSIDGGGIRGIIPAVVLCEYERRLGRQTAHAVDALAGTSTGGLISLMLSLPNQERPGFPRYKASEVLDLYLQNGEMIFQSNRNVLERAANWLVNLTTPKYLATGRQTLCNKICGETRLSEVLTEVVVPATKQDRPNITSFFSRSEALTAPADIAVNPKVSDVGMATSAAPTYFQGHPVVVGYRPMTINNANAQVDVPITQTYVDGGIQANNPAMLAYNFAMKKGITPEKVYIWSLGTGDCIRSSINQGIDKGQLFWAQQLHHFLGTQQNDVDEQLSTQLGTDRYRRFQFWMDKDNVIPLDDIRGSAIEYLQNAGHEIVEEYSDELNTVVERARQRFDMI